jgi:hypothetical protein
MLRARIEGRLADTDGNAFLCQQHLPVRAAVALPVDQPKLPAPDIGVGETAGTLSWWTITPTDLTRRAAAASVLACPRYPQQI